MSQVAEFEERQRAALGRLDTQLRWYNWHKHQNRILFYVCITLSFIASGSSPFAVWFSDSKVLQSTLPGIAALLTGILSIFQFQRNWVRDALVVEALRSEEHKYRTRAGEHYSRKIDNEDALETFVIRVENIFSEEVNSWQQSIDSVQAPEGNTGKGKQTRRK